MRMTDDDVQALAVREFDRQRSQRLAAGGHERGPQQQVLGRIAGERELGREHEPRTLGPGAARGGGDEARVAGEVADGGVDLRQCCLQRDNPLP